MCKQFAEGEFCELGDDCHFAHGQDELRSVRADTVAGVAVAGAGKVGPQYKTRGLSSRTCPFLSFLYISCRNNPLSFRYNSHRKRTLARVY